MEMMAAKKDLYVVSPESEARLQQVLYDIRRFREMEKN